MSRKRCGDLVQRDVDPIDGVQEKEENKQKETSRFGWLTGLNSSIFQWSISSVSQGLSRRYFPFFPPDLDGSPPPPPSDFDAVEEPSVPSFSSLIAGGSRSSLLSPENFFFFFFSSVAIA